MTGRADSTSTRRVRRWIVAALLGVALASIGLALATTATTGQRNAVGAADEIIERIGDRTVDLVGAELGDARQALDLLAQLLGDGVVGHAFESAGTDGIAAPRDLASSGAVLDEILATQLRTFPQLSGAYVGFPDGSFRFVRREDDALYAKRITTDPERVVVEYQLGDDGPGPPEVATDDDYDPRARPWYQQATTSLRPVWTDPYVFFSSGEAGVTTAIALRDDTGGVSAVIGVDLQLSALSRFVDDLPIDASAEAFIVAGDQVVAAPTAYDLSRAGDDGGLTLATVDELGLDRTDGDVVVFDRPLQDSRLPSWSVLVRADDIEFVDVVRHQTRIALLAIAIASAVLLAAIVFVTRRLRRPIDELAARADIDPLTGVLNRRAFLEQTAELVERCRLTERELAVAVLDIDDFKAINDRYGHGVGDLVLLRLARALGNAISDGIVGRLGGDEFVIGLPVTDRLDGEAALRAAKTAVDESLHRDATTATSTVTIGATTLGARDVGLRELITEADLQLLAVKRAGKDAIGWHDHVAEHVPQPTAPQP